MPAKKSDSRLLRIYESKSNWHKTRAKMKPEEKYEILVKLQILAAEVCRASGRPVRRPWPL